MPTSYVSVSLGGTTYASDNIRSVNESPAYVRGLIRRIAECDAAKRALAAPQPRGNLRRQ